MHKTFDHQEIEKKWQNKWREDSLYDVGARDKSKEKEYVLVELPYPSGNLHVGHWHAFAVPDIYVRYKRMTGKQVIFPMGFDAFGLPAENAAIKNNADPKAWTEGNIEYMKGQLASMGASFSWDKTISTTDPNYYRWTQWMFTKFFESGIAYRGEGTVNWCSNCQTVIANEQVTADDTCERCGTAIEKKTMPQWMLKITDFADELIDDLENLDWPDHIKQTQINWIGRSKGALLPFELSSGDKIEVFTTRPDTLYGATYMVLAPEHELLTKNQEKIENWDEVADYIEATKQKKDQDRLDNTKDKTGVKVAGLTATNPVNGETLPVYIADYVLASYGTGAIMAVPAHDERDHAFATKYDLPIKPVVSNNETNLPNIGLGKLINSGEFDGMDSDEAKVAITKKVGGKEVNNYRLRDWSVGRQRYWGVPIPIVYSPEGEAHTVPEEHLPWILPEDVDFRPTGEPPLAKSAELKKRTEDIFGPGWTPEVETMDTFVDSSWYFLRYLDNNNQQTFCSEDAQKDWMPVDIYFGGSEHTTMHLLYSRFWVKALRSLGLTKLNEPYSKRINRGLIMGPDGNKMSKSKGNVIDPDEQVALVGADTVKMSLAFMGPYNEVANYPWDLGGIAGQRRFLERVCGLTSHLVDEMSEDVKVSLHKTIAKVATDITNFKFNTAISAMMVFLNQAEKKGLDKTAYEDFLKVLAPFAPHLTEELWSNLDHKESIHLETYPDYDPELLVDKEVTIGVQINGKMRGQITLSPEATEEQALEIVNNDEQLKDRLTDQKIVKIIYVPGRILNLIVKS